MGVWRRLLCCLASTTERASVRRFGACGFGQAFVRASPETPPLRAVGRYVRGQGGIGTPLASWAVAVSSIFSPTATRRRSSVTLTCCRPGFPCARARRRPDARTSGSPAGSAPRSGTISTCCRPRRSNGPCRPPCTSGAYPRCDAPSDGFRPSCASDHLSANSPDRVAKSSPYEMRCNWSTMSRGSMDNDSQLTGGPGS